MSIPTDENRDLLSVIATIRARSGKVDELRALLESLVGPTRAEDGNVTYALHQGAQDPAVFVFYENWTSQEHLDAHLGSPELHEALGRASELLDGDVAIVPLKRLA